MGCGAVIYSQSAEKNPEVLEKKSSGITTGKFVGRKNGQQKSDKDPQFKDPVGDSFNHLFFKIFIYALTHTH